MSSRAASLPADVREEYPFASHLLTLKGASGGAPVQMHYLDEGTGPVVLMLHGNPTWSFYYRNLVKTLVARGFRCIVPDHIGCGLSDKPQDYPYRLEQRIDDVAMLLDHLGISRFSLVVHDWGGAIGFGLIARRPEAVEKIVVLNTAAFRSKRIPLRIAVVKMPVVGEYIIRACNGFAGPAAVMSVTQPLSPAVKSGFLWPYRNWRDRIAVWRFVKDIPLSRRHPSYAQLETIESSLPQFKEKPMLILWGGRDFCFNRHFLDRWRSFFPAARVETEEAFGHYILEDGKDKLIPKIAKFFSE